MTPRSTSSYTVLVVDDDPSVLDTYRRLLARIGYRTLAESEPGRVLSEGFAGCGVDLLLLDYKMPAMDGLSLLAELRRRECSVPCVLVSAFLNEDVRRQATSLGVAKVLEKPVGVDSLRRTLGELLPVVASPTAKVAW